MKKTLLALGFLAGLVIAGTANLQLTVGVVLLIFCALEFRKSGVSIEQIDDEILAELKKVLNRE